MKPSAHVSLDCSLVRLSPVNEGVWGSCSAVQMSTLCPVRARANEPPGLQLEVRATASCRAWGGVPDALEAVCGHSARYLLAQHR